MIRNIFNSIIGTYRISVSDESRTKAADILYRYGISAIKPQYSKTGDYSFTVSILDKRKLCRLFDLNEIKYFCSEVHGFPKVLKFLKKRPGIIVSIVMFILSAVYFSKIIWSIEINGNENIPSDVIIASLDELGCGYGDLISKIDFDSLHAEFLAKNHDIAWISVNMKGNHANVVVIENKPGIKHEKEENTYANIVASEDAEIIHVEINSGVSQVVPGNIVKKGDILVSGVIGVREDRLRYEYASASVMAYVPRVAEVTIPFENEEKTYTGAEKTNKSIKIFKKNINLSSKGSIEYSTYDKIIDNRQVYLLGVFPLPVWIENSQYREYEYVKSESGYETIAASAMQELRDMTDDILLNCEIASKKITTELTEDEYRIKCEMMCITDIAKVSKFTVNE